MLKTQGLLSDFGIWLTLSNFWTALKQFLITPTMHQICFMVATPSSRGGWDCQQVSLNLANPHLEEGSSSLALGFIFVIRKKFVFRFKKLGIDKANNSGLGQVVDAQNQVYAYAM